MGFQVDTGFGKWNTGVQVENRFSWQEMKRLSGHGNRFKGRTMGFQKVETSKQGKSYQAEDISCWGLPLPGHLSELPEASRNSWGWNSMVLTGPLCSFRSVSSLPAVRSHSCPTQTTNHTALQPAKIWTYTHIIACNSATKEYVTTWTAKYALIVKQTNKSFLGTFWTILTQGQATSQSYSK